MPMVNAQGQQKPSTAGKTPEQKKAIKYLFGGGCLFGQVKDSDYDAMVKDAADKMNFKQKALGKIGLDEDQVNEIKPVTFQNYKVDKTSYDKLGKDGKWRSSKYQVTWLFFSSTQVYMYSYTLNMDSDAKSEQTEEYFYKDIVNFSTTTVTEEKWVGLKKENIETSQFVITVPGDKFYAAVEASDEVERSIQAMKQKLREKKM